MRNFRTPGVYIRDVEVKPPPRVRMDITGFVGQAERGPLDFPQPLTSWGEYLDIFGGFVGYGYLPYCVFTFFGNGGEKCYVVRVAHEKAAKAAVVLKHEGMPLIRVEAINEGAWANGAEAGPGRDGVEVVAESYSTDDLVLTEFADRLPEKESSVKLKSVAGLRGRVAEKVKGDQVKLLHPGLPTQQEQTTVEKVDPAQGTVVFENSVSRTFPPGTRVLGKGFKLTFRYTRDGRLTRGEVFDNLSADPAHERYFVRVINGDPAEPDYIKRVRAGSSILVRVTDLRAGGAAPGPRIPDQSRYLSGGDDGDPAQVGIKHFIGPEDDPQANQPSRELFGLAAFEAVEEIGLVAIPDLGLPDFYEAAKTTKTIRLPEQGVIFAEGLRPANGFGKLKEGQAAMLLHCQRMGERFALLDSPRGAEIGRGGNKIEEWPSNFQLLTGARYGALYYPWVGQQAADFAGRELFIPPCGAVAGVYSRSEQERGVGKAPANEILRGAVELEFCLDDEQQGVLNPKGVNCLRIFPGRGLRIWGARTLSPDPLSIYVNVRRVVLSVLKNILVNLRWTVFEPNDQQLRDKIAGALNLFLQGLFEAGALAGASPKEAFFVKCDEENNPPQTVDLGQVITEVGFAPERPAEFVLVTIKRSPGALSVLER
ncbi:MAG TPA: phage tail sheath subtilisin-like domain-containing protein [Pyrinomonadaceae bacterium]|jgi:hypothetical protein|nr:phage tail sheath subtilisin-like domain-containing protein [Pyrinomonadaceae bacterium]